MSDYGRISDPSSNNPEVPLPADDPRVEAVAEAIHDAGRTWEGTWTTCDDQEAYRVEARAAIAALSPWLLPYEAEEGGDDKAV